MPKSSPHSASGGRAAAGQAPDSLYQQSFELAPLGLGHIASDGRWLAVNRALCELLGYSHDELLARPLSALTHPDDRHVDSFESRRLVQGDVASVCVSKRLIHESGRQVRVEQTTGIIRDRGAEFFVVSIAPRRPRRLSAPELDVRAREERFRLALEGSNDGVWDWEIPTGRVYYSRGWKRILGLNDADIGDDYAAWRDRVHPDDVRRAQRSLEGALQLGRRWHSQEFRMRHKDGSYRHVLSRAVISRDADGRAVRMTGTHVDITGIRQTEAALRRTQSQLATVINSLDIGIVTFALDGMPQHWNPSALAMIGADGADQLMQPARALTELFELTTPDGTALPPAQWPLARVLRGERIDGELLQLRRRDKDVTRLLRCGGALIHQPDGQPFLALLTMTDVTAHKNAENQLIQARAAFDTTQEGIAITDLEGCIIAVNRGFSTITEYSEADVIGHNIGMLGSGKHDETFYADMWTALAAEGSWQGEIWNRRKSGELYPQWLIIDTIRQSGTDEPTGYVAVFNDMTRMKHVTTHLEYLAFHDALTGLANRAALKTRLGQSLDRARREQAHTAVLFLDLDKFKDVNDQLGHAAGDELLSQIAVRLRERARGNDTVARFGGDEFVLVLDDIENQTAAAAVARTIIDNLSHPFTIQGNTTVQIGASIGVAVYPEHGRDAHALLSAADRALYAAKAAESGNCFRFAGTHDGSPKS